MEIWVAARELEQLEKLLDGLWALHDARGWYHATLEFANDVLESLSSVPSSPSRARKEITLRTALARGLMAIRGYTEEVEEAYNRALEVSEEAGELPRRFPVLRNLASFYVYRGEFDKAAAVGRELLDLADREDDAAQRVEGHLVVGSSVAFEGDISAALDHLGRAIALFDPQRHRPGPFRLGASAGVVAHTTSALVLWFQGSPDRSAERAAAGVALAEQLKHPFTLAYALFHVGFLNLLRREPALARERGSRVLNVAEDHDYEIWRALAITLQGAAATKLGSPGEGVAQIDRGVALYQGLKTPPVFWPLLLSLRADAFGASGRAADGLPLIEEAIETIGEANVLYSEFALVKGDLLLALADPDRAKRSFESAFDVAVRFGTRIPQLRAASRLTRLWRPSGRQPDGTDVLRSVYDTFTEGFDTRDLVEARAVLEDAGAGVP